jgi:phosphoribulokinase
VRHILRPTLPHPDFGPLFDGSSNAGLRLELARDRDGKPVDVLEINGNISDQHAERIEDLLWNLIPEAGHLRDQVGRIDVANGSPRSHPLALTQLLVGYHAVKAAMGVRAY